MKLSRRQLFGLGGAASIVSASGIQLPAKASDTTQSKIRWAEETATICPYCAVGCGMIVKSASGKVIDVEGDPDHPINQGTLCSKGASLTQLVNNNRRIDKPMYRPPKGGQWQYVEWDWVLDQIAQRIKQTRDAGWIEKDSKNRVVRRTEAIASAGSAALDNEECSLLVKALRGMGLVYIEHQARI
jgi:formate dehydrogenase major subunit